MHSSSRIPLGLTLAALLLAAVGAFATLASACDTPVYRYAMYRWEPTPYELYYFHRGTPTAEAAAIQETVDQASQDKAARANVVYLPVNLDEDEELINVPIDVKQAWLALEKPQLPSYMLVTPRGVQVYQGGVDKTDVAALLQSPARAQFAKLLEQGSTGVFLFLEGKNAEANKAALTVLDSVIADVEAGEIKLYSGAVDMFPDAPKAKPADDGDKKVDDKKADDNMADKDRTRHNVGLIRITRDDAQEAWLRRILMATERDLDQYGDEPMVFAVYGRGRALPAFIGDGISRDNLLDCLYFISGACSCTVKEQNPGVDLLVRHDWNAAAEKLAEKYGSEEGNDKFGVDNLFPELVFATPSKSDGGAKSKDPSEDPAIAAQADAIIAAQQDKPTASDNATDDEPTTTNPTPAEATDAGSKAPSTGDTTGVDAESVEKAAEGKNDAESPEQQVAMTTSPAADETSTHNKASDLATAASTTLWYTLGVGVGIAVFVLLSATLLLYRPR
ncbi:MAG: hypothetical protein RIC55_14870 [Pirellulaceae bacterium]